jgi:hypothetical protein
MFWKAANLVAGKIASWASQHDKTVMGISWKLHGFVVNCGRPG